MCYCFFLPLIDCKLFEGKDVMLNFLMPYTKETIGIIMEPYAPIEPNKYL